MVLDPLLSPRYWALAGLLLIAQPGQAQEPPTFSDAIDDLGVDVEVVVTNRQGESVAGLACTDFRLLVDGTEVEILSFQEIREGRVIAPSAVSRAGAEISRRSRRH